MLAVVLAVVGVALAVGLLWWPGTLPTARASTRQLRGERRLRRRVPSAGVAVAAGAAGGLAAVWAAVGPFAAPGGAAASAACVWAIVVQIASGRAVRAAGDMAQFCSGLANQGTVARTVEDALRQALPAAGGAVAAPAAALVDDAEAFGVGVAARRFAATVDTTTGRRVASVVSAASEGGTRWAELAEMAQEMASQELITREHFHRGVGAMMPQIVSAAVISAAIVAMVGLFMADAREWFQEVAGQVVISGTGLLWAAIIGRVCAPAWRQVR